jgi:hypothetical protein
VRVIHDAHRVCTAPTVGKETYLSLSRVLHAVQELAVNNKTTVDQVAVHLEVTNVQTVLVPALHAIVAKGFLEWEGTHTLRIL